MTETASETNEVMGAYQTGRALIGWMTADEAALSLSGRRTDIKNKEEHAQRAEKARAAVAARPTWVDKAAVTNASPPELDGHIAALRQNVASAQYFAEGWQVSVVDLSSVCAAQPQIKTSQSTQRVEAIVANNILSLAAISLPIAAPTAFPALFDQSKNAWIFSSPNPNLRITGNFSGQVAPGQQGYGFMVGISTSFLQVALYKNRYLLRDGYHRAFGFLSRGIARVPAFFREITRYEELGFPAGMLPQDSYLGQRPPTLQDYLDESVSAEVQVPMTEKMVLVQALDFTTLG